VICCPLRSALDLVAGCRALSATPRPTLARSSLNRDRTDQRSRPSRCEPRAAAPAAHTVPSARPWNADFRLAGGRPPACDKVEPSPAARPIFHIARVEKPFASSQKHFKFVRPRPSGRARIHFSRPRSSPDQPQHVNFSMFLFGHVPVSRVLGRGRNLGANVPFGVVDGVRGAKYATHPSKAVGRHKFAAAISAQLPTLGRGSGVRPRRRGLGNAWSCKPRTLHSTDTDLRPLPVKIDIRFADLTLKPSAVRPPFGNMRDEIAGRRNNRQCPSTSLSVLAACSRSSIEETVQHPESGGRPAPLDASDKSGGRWWRSPRASMGCRPRPTRRPPRSRKARGGLSRATALLNADSVSSWFRPTPVAGADSRSNSPIAPDIANPALAMLGEVALAGYFEQVPGRTEAWRGSATRIDEMYGGSPSGRPRRRTLSHHAGNRQRQGAFGVRRPRSRACCWQNGRRPSVPDVMVPRRHLQLPASRHSQPPPRKRAAPHRYAMRVFGIIRAWPAARTCARPPDRKMIAPHSNALQVFPISALDLGADRPPKAAYI